MDRVGLVQAALAPLRRARDAIDAIQGATDLDASLFGGYSSVIEPLKNKPEVVAANEIERELRQLADLFTRVAELISEYTAARGSGWVSKRFFKKKRSLAVSQHVKEELQKIDREVMRQLAMMVLKGAISPESVSVLQHGGKNEDRLFLLVNEMHPPSLQDMAAVPAGALALPRSYVGRSGVQEVVDGLTKPDEALAPYTVVGMGGSGKTMLASAVVREESVRKHFRGGIFWMRVGKGAKNSLLRLLQFLAREIGAAPTNAPHGVPHSLDTLEAAKQHLAAVGSARTSPRLVVLDDVWEREVVDALLSVGLKVLVTTRDRSVVGVPGGLLQLGNMTEDEALELLWRTSVTAGQPENDVQTQMAKVATLCGRMPLALAIAGSMAVVTEKGSTAAAWEELAKEFENGAGMMWEIGQQSSSIDLALQTSFAALSKRKRVEMLKMAVLAAGAIAPIEMLLNLWETEDVEGTREEADGLVSKSLLEDVGEGYRVHDLILEYLKIKITADAALAEKATTLQAQYLRRLDVVEGYGDQEHGAGNQGLFTLDALWRSVEKLSGDPGLEVASYRASLGELESCDAVDHVATSYWSVGRLFYLQGKYAEAERLYERCQEIREKALGAEHPDVARTLTGRAGLLEKQGKYFEADLLYLRAIEIGEETVGPEHPDVATTLSRRAGLLEKQGKYAEAEPLYEHCQAMLEKVLGPEHPDVATTLNGRAGLLEKQGKYAEAEPLYERCQAMLEKVLGPGHPDVARTLNGRAELFEKQGKYAKAEPLYDRCQAMLEKVLGPEHPDVATTLNGRAGLLQRQGKYAEAERLYERCQEIREKALGAEHPDVAKTLTGRAGLLEKQGKYTEAEPLYERCEEIFEKVLGPEHPDVATTLNGRAGLLEKQGKYAEAEPLYERCQAIREKALGPEHPDVATTLNGRAGLLRKQGKFNEAEPLYRRALAISENALGPDHPIVATTLKKWAGLLENQGNHTEAEPLYRRSLAIQEQIFGPDHPTVAENCDDLAGVLVAQGQYGEAEVLYEQSMTVRERSLGPEHPDVARTLTRMAILLDLQGKFVEAERFYERSLAILEISLGPAHPSVATSLNNLAVVQFRQGKYEEAAHQCSQALAIWEPIGDEYSTNIVMALTNLAIGAYDDAIALYKKALEVAVATLGKNNPQSVSLGKRLAEAVEKNQVSDNAAATAEPESKLDSPSGDGGLKGTTTTAKPESNLTSPSEAGVPDSSTTAKSKWKLGHPSEYCLQGRAQLLPEISGDSELHLAVQHGNIELVEVLLVRPVRPINPDIRGKGEMTPLHEAVHHRHEEIVRMLLRHGADANLGNGSGRTPLHMACAIPTHPEAMVAMLLDWGADPRIRDHQGQVPLAYAGPDPDPEMERMLAPAEESDCEKTIILAHSLGCDAKVFSSVTFGVELELEHGTLDAEVPEPVTIASEVRIVQCSDGRDTSRTHEELAARAAESCMTDPGPNAFVAMPFVHGPSSVKFNDECPAKLRFFVGFVDDFEDVDDEEDEGHKATSDLKTLLLRKFEPLVSPDEVFWTMQMPFEVIERPQLGLPTEAWLETKIYHFSTFALADVNPGFKDPGSDLLKDWYVLGDVPRRLPPWRRSGWSRKKPSIFLLGNATTSQDYIFFYIIKNNDIIAAAQSDGKNANLTLPWGGAGGGKDRSRQETMTSHGTNNIYKWDVPQGRYFPADPIVDGRFVHQAVTVVVGFLEENQASPPSNNCNMVFAVLDMKPLQVNKMFVVTEARIEAWKKLRGDTLQSNKERDVLAFVRAQNLSSSAAPSHGPSGSATLTSP